MGTTPYKSGTFKKLLTALAFLPIGVMLFIQSMGWPNNFDDFYRGFNGINTDHDVLQYGWLKSQEMLKHLVHDPLLTWSNQLDYRWPFITGIVETILLVGFMSMVTRNALTNGNRHIAFAIILLLIYLLGFNPIHFCHQQLFHSLFQHHSLSQCYAIQDLMLCQMTNYSQNVKEPGLDWDACLLCF